MRDKLAQVARDRDAELIAEEEAPARISKASSWWHTLQWKRIRRLAGLIASVQSGARFQAEAVHTAKAARERILDGAFDAVVLDLSLPERDGLELLREADVTVPVLVLTTRIGVDDRVAGQNAGADD